MKHFTRFSIFSKWFGFKGHYFVMKPSITHGFYHPSCFGPLSL